MNRKWAPPDRCHNRIMIYKSRILLFEDNWTHWGLNPGPSECESDVIPLHHVPRMLVLRTRWPFTKAAHWFEREGVSHCCQLYLRVCAMYVHVSAHNSSVCFIVYHVFVALVLSLLQFSIALFEVHGETCAPSCLFFQYNGARKSQLRLRARCATTAC